VLQKKGILSRAEIIEEIRSLRSSAEQDVEERYFRRVLWKKSAKSCWLKGSSPRKSWIRL
jgi:hypothetical protein